MNFNSQDVLNNVLGAVQDQFSDNVLFQICQHDIVRSAGNNKKATVVFIIISQALKIRGQVGA